MTANLEQVQKVMQIAINPEDLKSLMEVLQTMLDEEYTLGEMKNEFSLQTMADEVIHNRIPNRIPQSNTFMDGKTRKPAYQRMNKQKLRKGR